MNTQAYLSAVAADDLKGVWLAEISLGTQVSREPEDKETLYLGVQLRHARLVKGFRLKDVAERSGCSESLLSKIEHNKAMPSINTLHRVAKTLGTTVAALLNQQGKTGGVVMHRRDRPIIREVAVAGLESDGTEAEVLIPLGASALLQAIVLRIKPGGSSNGLRQHDGEEVGLVTAGKLELTVSGKKYSLKEGDSFFYNSNEPHGFRNIGTQPAEIIWVNTPATL